MRSPFSFLTSRFDPHLVRLFAYLGAYKGMLAAVVVMLLVTACTSSAIAMILGQLTDLGFYQGQRWAVFAGPAALLGVSLVSAASSVGSTVVMARVSQNVLVTLRTALFARILRWPAAQYQTLSTGQVSAKFVNEATIALSGATESFMVLVRDSMQIVALLAVLFWHNWQLTLVTFLLAPALALVLRSISRRMRLIVKASQDNVGAMLSRVEESYGAQKLVKAAGGYDREDTRFAAVNDRSRSLALSTVKMQSLATPVTQLITMVAVAFVVGVALWEAQRGLLTFGAFVTFMTAMLLLRDPIQKLSGLNGTFASIAVAARSVFGALDAPVEEDSGTEVLSRAHGDVAFEHVSLTYPGAQTPALTDVSFCMKAGEHVALVGRSGSGKTSLVNLLTRFWLPTVGRVTVDGKDVRDYTLASLRSQIAVVSQDTELFDDTIRANLTYEVPAATDEQIREAVHAAALDEFVAGLPQGLDTRVGEEGGLLSGGQKQRLCIARAFLKNAPILILDEATSALDSDSESAVKAALARLTHGKTTITVAHRFTTIADADRIVALEGGVVREQGTPAELLARPQGLFHQLYELQTAGRTHP